jgi:bis(5'-adenosyl)-triphosphatase
VFYQSPSGLTLGVVNLKPLVPGHVLVIPKRVESRYSGLTPLEQEDLWQSVRKVQAVVCAHWCGTSSGSGSTSRSSRGGRGGDSGVGGGSGRGVSEDSRSEVVVGDGLGVGAGGVYRAGRMGGEEPAGAHLGLQDGPNSGQSVAHVHVHILPAHSTAAPAAGPSAAKPGLSVLSRL